MDGVVELAERLIRCDTVNPPGGEVSVAVLLAKYLHGHGIEAEVDEFEPNRANLVARVGSSRRGPRLVYSGHLDTVGADATAWSDDPWSPTRRNGSLYGRGAADMKGAVAAMTVALTRLSSAEPDSLAGEVLLALTAGEEVDSRGARRLVDRGYLHDVDWIVVGEPTAMDVGIGHKGALWVELEARGQSAHGSQPERGSNAIRALLEWLTPFSAIEQLVAVTHDALGRASVSLNTIAGGTAPNVVPDRCRCVLDFRTVPPIRHAEVVSALNGRSSRVAIRVIRDNAPVATNPAASLVAAAAAAVEDVVRAKPAVRTLPYVTDASVFAAASPAELVLCGPGDEKQAHVEDEHVDLQALRDAVDVYVGLAQNLLEH